MGMRISGSNPTTATLSTGSTQWQQRQQGFKDLMSSLQSGDLGAAQKAYAALAGGSASTTASGTTSTSDATGSKTLSPLAQIGQALQNGDLAGAQKAAQSLQAARSGQHHGHHHGQAPTQSTPPATGNPISTTGNGVGSLLNVKA